MTNKSTFKKITKNKGSKKKKPFKNKSKKTFKNKSKKQQLSNNNLILIPSNSTSKDFIKLEFPNIKVAQCEYTEGPVGLTFITFNKPTLVHMEIRGGDPAYINCLSNNNKQRILGINIAGGSLLGLESTTGIIAESLKHKNYNMFMGVNGSIIYSHNLYNNKIYPDKKLGRFAFNQNDTKLYNGQVAAGLSASHGQGWAYKKLGKIKILALCVNNAIGTVYSKNKPVHYPNDFDKNWLSKIKLNQNTTIIVVITNIKLDIIDLKQMNHQLNVAIGENIRPFNTLYDGDIFYTCSTEEIKKKYDSTQKIILYNECTKVLQKAILNSVK